MDAIAGARLNSDSYLVFAGSLIGERHQRQSVSTGAATQHCVLWSEEDESDGICRDLLIRAANTLRLISHPPDSPNLALSDLFLFGVVQYSLQGMICLSHEEFLAPLSEGVIAIRIETLYGGCEHSMDRLEQVSQNNNQYNP
jgi:hypothetical protein